MPSNQLLHPGAKKCTVVFASLSPNVALSYADHSTAPCMPRVKQWTNVVLTGSNKRRRPAHVSPWDSGICFDACIEKINLFRYYNIKNLRERCHDNPFSPSGPPHAAVQMGRLYPENTIQRVIMSLYDKPFALLCADACTQPTPTPDHASYM